MHKTAARPRLIGPLPTHGIWNAVDLTRGQCLSILALSVALFVFLEGQLWRHAHEGHLVRIGLSYAVIPVAVAAALRFNRKLRLVTLVAASAVIALAKLVLTALLLVIIGLAQT